MKLKTTRFRELMDLKQVLTVSFLIALYALHLLVNHLFFGSAATLPPQGLIVFLVFWMIGAVWVAYRRWMLIGMTERDLDDVLTGINPDVFVVIDPERRISMCSPAIKRVFGYTPEEVLGRTTDVLYFDRRPMAGNPRGIHDQLERVGFHIGEAKGRLRDGGTIPLEIVTGTIRGRKGAVLLIRDVTKRVEIEQAHREKEALLHQLEAQYKQLRESEGQRETLMHMIVHDMKNPLQIILGNLQMLKDRQTGEAAAEDAAYVDETLIHTRRLSDLVSSILDISRLEAGQMPLHPTPCDLRVAARRAVSTLQRMVGDRHVEIVAPADPLMANCDAELIDRVLINLISNGVHHTPDTVRLEIRLRPGVGTARVEVADNGPGIAPALKSNLFRKFASGAGGTADGHVSTGLGLTFCKLAVETHGGQIGFDSPPQGGTVFWFELPSYSGNSTNGNWCASATAR